MRAIIFAAFLLLAPVAAVAQASPPPASTGPVAVGQAMAHVDQQGQVAIVQAPASVSFGSLGGELLQWLALVFGAPIATFITLWMKALAKRAGVEVTAAMSDKLDGIIQNGLMAGAHNIGADMKGRLNVDVRNDMVAQAVAYAQAHGADTIKDLSNSNTSFAWMKSFDPNSAAVQEALRARAAKVLNDVSPPGAVTKPPATTTDTAAPAPAPGGAAAAPLAGDPPPTPSAAPPAASPAPAPAGASPA
jgi:hypothetical protein